MWDAELFSWLEEHVEALVNRDIAAVEYVVRKSISIKAAIVAQDALEGDKGLRVLLNLGHTFGHAIELQAGYGEWLHGEAVAVGMVMAADLSYRKGLIDQATFDRTKALLARLRLPISLCGNQYSAKDTTTTWDAASILEAMHRDKKAEKGQMRLVLMAGRLGAAKAIAEPDLALLSSVIEAYCH